MSSSSHSQGPNAPKTALPHQIRQKLERTVAGAGHYPGSKHGEATGPTGHQRTPKVLRIIGNFGFRRRVPQSLLEATDEALEHEARLRVYDGNLFLVRWISLSLLVLTLVLLLMLSGIYEQLETQQIILLCDEPFLMDAEQLQQPLLGRIGTFTASVLVTLYLGLVMLREPRWGKRTQLACLATLVLAMPGFLCVLWGGIINPFAPMTCVPALWLLTSLVPFYNPRRS